MLADAQRPQATKSNPAAQLHCFGHAVHGHQVRRNAIVGLVLLGTALFWQDIGISARVIIIITFLFLTAPVAAHVIGRAAYFDKVPLWDKTKVDELKGKYDEISHELKSTTDKS